MLKRNSLTVSTQLDELSTVQQWFETHINHFALESPWLKGAFDQLNLALAEGFTNAVRHAHADLPQHTPIDIELSLRPDQIEICIFDRGEPFDPNSLHEPTPGALREGGYGWFLLRRLADQVTYECMPIKPRKSSNPPEASSSANELDPRNCLRIVKTAKVL